MSVWTKVQSKALYQNVDMRIFEEAIAELGLTLNYNVTEVSNSFGKSKVNAAIENQGKQTALGIIKTTNGGITLAGDTWRSGIVGDKQANKLIDMMAQAYQKTKVKKELELQGWTVNEVKKEDKIVLQCMQY